MTDRLMRQVEEIRRRAHVCRYCKGTGRRTVYLGDLGQPSMSCTPCNGTGQVPAPDTDALCAAVVTLAQAVEARDIVCQFEYGDLEEFKAQICNDEQANAAALALLSNGMHPGEHSEA